MLHTLFVGAFFLLVLLLLFFYYEPEANATIKLLLRRNPFIVW